MGVGRLTAVCILWYGAAVARDAAAGEVPGSRAECEQRGGRWGQHGLLPEASCRLPAGDAGKACRSSAECESGCIAPEGAKPGEEGVTGRCHAYRSLIGTCLSRVEGGRVGAVLCVD